MRSFMFCSLLLAFIGCSESTKASKEAVKETAASDGASGSSQVALLKPTMMAMKPTTAISVTEAMQRKTGETVVVAGMLPPENVKPFNTAFAAFVMLSPEALAREEVKDELACEDAATCPSCRKLLDSLGVRVELVDKSGAVIPTTLEGFSNLKPGSTITVEGEIKRDGKDNKLVRIVANRFYPE